MGLNIIRQEHKTLGFKAGFTIFDAEDGKALIKELMLKDYEDSGDEVKDVQMVISNWKNAMRTPEQAKSYATDDRELMMAHIYQRYDQALRAYNAVDFDDLILLPVYLFQIS